jgi:hypothetical protein
MEGTIRVHTVRICPSQPGSNGKHADVSLELTFPLHPGMQVISLAIVPELSIPTPLEKSSAILSSH